MAETDVISLLFVAMNEDNGIEELAVQRQRRQVDQEYLHDIVQN